MLLTVYGGVHVRRRIFRGGQGFAAFGRKFEGPLPPLDVFDTFLKVHFPKILFKIGRKQIRG